MWDDRPITRWVLFDGDRVVLSGLLLLGMFCFLVALGVTEFLALTDSDAVDTIASGLVPGLFTFLSIVLAINQLVLTQSFGSADEVRERAADVRTFRHDVEAASGAAPSPIHPTDFLRVLVGSLATQAEALGSLAAEDDSPAGEATRDFATTVRAAADRADDRVAAADPGRVNAVLTLLEYDDAQQLYEARRIRARYGDDLSPAVAESVDHIVELLELFDVARTHFRTTYTQRALSRLSRFLLYVGLPAILATFVLGMSTFPGIDGWVQVVVASALFCVTLSPLALLSSYILRVAAVSERTIGVGPFVSRPGTVEEPSVTSASQATESASDYGASGDASPSGTSSLSGDERTEQK